MNKRTVKTRSYQEFQTYLVSGAINSHPLVPTSLNSQTFSLGSLSKIPKQPLYRQLQDHRWMKILFTGGGRGKLPLANVSASPPKKTSFPEKKLKAILNTDLIIKKSMRVTKVQKCDFSQSWTPYQAFYGLKYYNLQKTEISL